MDKALKDKWMKALRSGEYGQARGRLRRTRSQGHAFCCLGVLADVIDNDEWSSDNLWRAAHQSYLPGDIVRMNDQYDLVAKNDDGAPFPKIADWIEENIPVEETSATRTGEANAE